MRAPAGLLAPLLATALAGVDGPTSYRFERPVTPGAPGRNRLLVDGALLSGAAPLRYRPLASGTGGDEPVPSFEGGLEDLRFFDAGGHEVGYLLIGPKSDSPAWRKGTLLPIAATKQESGFEVDLGGVVRTDAISIEGIPAPYLKRVRLEGGGDRTRWTLLAAEGTVFSLPTEGLAHERLGFPAGEFRYFRVTWDDRSSGRVPLPRRVSARRALPAAAAPPVFLTAVFERRPSEPGRSRFRVRLPAARLPVTALELSVAGGHLLRPVGVFEPRLSESGVVPAPLGAGTLRRVERGGLVAANLTVPVAFPEGPDLDVVVEDGDNAPLPLSGVRARLAPLPWIYLESSDGAGLTARFGAVGARAPRYDLEAVRDRVIDATPAEARWGERREAPPSGAAAPSAPPSIGAPVDAAGFRHARRLPPAAAGLNALQLDAAVLAGSDLNDLRLSDKDGRQTPYLLEKQDEPLSVELAPLERIADPQAPNRSRYRVRLPRAALPECRLVLSTPSRVFEREMSVWIERAKEGGGGGELERLAGATWRHAEPETPAPPLVLVLPRPGASELILQVDEGDNTFLPLEQPRLLLPSYRLRFFGAEGEGLTLLYGQPGLAAPRYDLALLSTRLVGAAAHELKLPSESAAPPRPVRGPSQAGIFWGVLIVTVAAFLALIVRLMRNAPPQTSEKE